MCRQLVACLVILQLFYSVSQPLQPESVPELLDVKPFGNSIDAFSDVHVQGQINALSVRAKDATFQGHVQVNGDLGAVSIDVDTLSAKSIRTGSIRAGASGVIEILGNVRIMDKSSKARPSSSSFLETKTTVISGEWIEVKYAKSKPGFSIWGADTTISSCPHAMGSFASSVCGQTISLPIHDIPDHSEIRIDWQVSPIDKWAGETAFAKLDGKTVWAETFDFTKHAGAGMDLCGNPSLPEYQFSIPRTASLAHSLSNLVIQFGDSGSANCSGMRILGIHNVQVFVR